MNFIERDIENIVKGMVPYFKIITITGPRQSGKTTLCKKNFPDYAYVNLEDISIREQATTAPKAFLLSFTSGVIIDEAHNCPELFSYLQVISDNYPDRRYVITGSSNFALLENITQSLAGRTSVLTLLPLSIQELTDRLDDITTDTLILNGSYPAVWVGLQPHQMLYSILKGLNYLTKLLDKRLTRSAIIYTGSEELDTPLNGIINYRKFRLS